MKKWIVPFLSVLLVCGLIYLSGPFSVFKVAVSSGDRGEKVRTGLTQAAEKEEGDSHWVQILRKVQDQLDEWLKSINDRIESEEASRLEVRFLEILRNILEWMKEKVDKRIESERRKGFREKAPLKEI